MNRLKIEVGIFLLVHVLMDLYEEVIRKGMSSRSK